MFRLLPKAFTIAAKAALIMTGAGFGLFRGLRLLDGLEDRTAELRSMEERLEGMQAQIAALHGRDDQLQAGLDRSVTADDLSAALDEAFERVQSGIDARFEDQFRSVEALRAMVSQTDELLERLLDRLESMTDDTELAACLTGKKKGRTGFCQSGPGFFLRSARIRTSAAPSAGVLQVGSVAEFFPQKTSVEAARYSRPDLSLWRSRGIPTTRLQASDS